MGARTCGAVATLACLLAALGAGAGATERPIRFERGSFVLSESETPPPDSAAWTPVRLTDLWRESRPGVQGRGWYRFRFELAAPPAERWAVYLPGLASNAAVWVNGEPVGDGGRMREPVALNSNRPLLLTRVAPQPAGRGEPRHVTSPRLMAS